MSSFTDSPPPRLEAGQTAFTSPSLADETTSLISHGQDAARYGSDGSGKTKRRHRTRVNVSEYSEEDDDEGSMPPKSGQRLSPSDSPASDSVPKSSSQRIWPNLTGGWNDRVSLRLQNSGSVARDHLALERTFLAYMRTSLAIASAGVALVQLFSTSAQSGTEEAQKLSRPLGASVISVGLGVLAIGLVRYFMVQAALIKGFFPVARLGVVVIAVALTTLVAVVFAILVTGTLEFEGLGL